MQVTPLSSKHLHTLERIYEHPTSHNLEWKDVTSLVEHLGSVEEEDHGRMKFTLNGASENFQRDHDKKDISEVQQIMDLRRFLDAAGIKKDGTMKHTLNTKPHTTGESRAAQGNMAPVNDHMPQSDTEAEAHKHDHGVVNKAQTLQAEQQLKTQQSEQHNRDAFPKGLASEHGKAAGTRGR